MAAHLVQLLQGIDGAERPAVKQLDEVLLIEPHGVAEVHRL